MRRPVKIWQFLTCCLINLFRQSKGGSKRLSPILRTWEFLIFPTVGPIGGLDALEVKGIHVTNTDNIN